MGGGREVLHERLHDKPDAGDTARIVGLTDPFSCNDFFFAIGEVANVMQSDYRALNLGVSRAGELEFPIGFEIRLSIFEVANEKQENN